MENRLIVKDNHLIESKGHLTIYEHKILAWCVAKLDKNDINFNVCELTRKEAILLLGFPENISIKRISDLIGGMYGKCIEIRDPKKSDDYHRFGLITSDGYSSKTQTFSIKISDDLKPFLLQLRANFTKLDLIEILRFKRSHTAKFYEICKKELMGMNEAYFERDMSEFKDFLGLKDNYKKYKDLKKWVFAPSIKELKEIAGLKVTITPSRYHSREYKKLFFDVEVLDLKKSGVWFQLSSFGLTEEQIHDIFKKYSNNEIRVALKKYGAQIGSGHFDNGTKINSKAAVFRAKLKSISERKE